MNTSQLVFDENMEMYVKIETLDSKVCLVLSDGLYAFEEELTDEYKEKIVAFINGISMWHQKVIKAVLDRGKEIYKIDATTNDLKLQSIFVLFEQF
jgi:hypothetical protein